MMKNQNYADKDVLLHTNAYFNTKSLDDELMSGTKSPRESKYNKHECIMYYDNVCYITL